jgi:exoribonuclease-2
VRVKLGEVDLMALDVHGTVTAHLDAPGDASDVAGDAPAQGADEDDEDDENEAMAAAPLTIALDLTDSTHSDGS